MERSYYCGCNRATEELRLHYSLYRRKPFERFERLERH